LFLFFKKEQEKSASFEKEAKLFYQ